MIFLFRHRSWHESAEKDFDGIQIVSKSDVVNLSPKESTLQELVCLNADFSVALG